MIRNEEMIGLVGKLFYKNTIGNIYIVYTNIHITYIHYTSQYSKKSKVRIQR